MDPAFGKDEQIIREGGMNQTLFFIEQGTVRVARMVEGKELILDDLKEGDAFGELTFLEAGPSSAACKALTGVKVLAIHRKEFDKIVKQEDDLVNQIKDIGRATLYSNVVLFRQSGRFCMLPLDRLY